MEFTNRLRVEHMIPTIATITGSSVGIWIYRACRWLLALVFLYAGLTKLIDPQAFAVIIAAYGIIPEALVMPTAIFLPALEALAAVGLILDVRGSLATIAILLLVFILVLGYGIWMGLDVDCGCYGPEDPEGKAYAGMRAAIIRDVVLAGGILLLYGCRRRYGLMPDSIPWRRIFIRKEQKV